jgi:RHS repeat-associated protein
VKEGISLIKWTPSGKVASVTKTDGSVLSFTYDGMGNRVRKVNTVAGIVVTETTYLRDGSGNVLATYNKSNSETQTTVEQTLYSMQRIGVRTISLPNNTEGNATVPTAVCNYQPSQKVYELSNHLGNVHAVLYNYKVGIDLNADGMADFYKAAIVNLSDYYSFGMNIDARTFTDVYRYGFNGKEKDIKEWNSGSIYDYGFRFYDPRIAKFLSVDPLTASYPWYTPYQFAGNKPINSIDLDGLEEKLSIINTYTGADGAATLSLESQTTDAETIRNYMISNGLPYLGPVQGVGFTAYYLEDGYLDLIRSQFHFTDLENPNNQDFVTLITEASFYAPARVHADNFNWSPPDGIAMVSDGEVGPGSGNARFGNSEYTIEISMLQDLLTGFYDCLKSGAILTEKAFENAYDAALKISQIIDRQQNIVEKSQQAAEEFNKIKEPVNQGLDGGGRPASNYPRNVDEDERMKYGGAENIGDTLKVIYQYDENKKLLQTDTINIK